MAKEVAKLYAVKVVPKELKAIPDVLPYKQFIQGEEKEVELTKSEILRCMNFGDVYLDGEDDPINTVTFKDLEEYEEVKAEEGGDDEGDDQDSGSDPLVPANHVPTPVPAKTKEDPKAQQPKQESPVKPDNKDKNEQPSNPEEVKKEEEK